MSLPLATSRARCNQRRIRPSSEHRRKGAGLRIDVGATMNSIALEGLESLNPKANHLCHGREGGRASKRFER